jgi:outer membrane protein OmpU
MKKILFTTTALVASTGFAMADGNLTWTGSANVGMKYSDNATTTVHSEIDLGVAASGETDGGIGWAVEMGLDSQTADSVATNAPDGGSVSLSGDFGVIKVGNVSTAGTSIGLADVGFDTIGIDDAAEKGRNAATASASMDVRWNYAMDDIALDVSFDTANDDMAASVKWSSGTLAIGISHAAAGATGGDTANAMSIGTTVGGFSVNVMAAAHSTSAKDSVGMSASMPVDGLGTVTFVTGSNDTDAKSSWGLGFSKSLGGGASLAGAYGSANGNDKADLGISLSF